MPRTFRQRLDQGRVIGHAQVVVAAKRQHFARRLAVTADPLARRARGLGDAALALEPLGLTLKPLAVQVFDQHRRSLRFGSAHRPA
ncbi:hypothetical protein LP417_33820 (plasmid) [Polaromonas sp. P1-6]|nr:hypothetical protein LP417_33820 [Polaromonas sp. P1-6]